MTGVERLLWTLVGRFERLALQQYTAALASLATGPKRAFLEQLEGRAGRDAELDGGPLGAAAEGILATVRGGSARRVLIAQAWVLELLGRTVYGLLAARESTGEETRSLARDGQRASESVLQALPPLLAAHVGEGDALFDALVSESTELLSRLDEFGERVDAAFGEPLGLAFVDVVGELSAALVSSCQARGLERRRVLGHLTSALMGLG